MVDLALPGRVRGTPRRTLPARPGARSAALIGALIGALTGALLAGCATPPPAPGRVPAAATPAPAVPPPPAPAPVPAGRDQRDGPGANPPPDLHLVPDAEPRLETVRPGGPNKPYEVLGARYTPLSGDPPLVERGLASWYGRKFHGRSTANGEAYNMYAMTAAHRTMPLPSYARVRNPANGREVVVRVNDRGPFHSERVIDLSYTAALKLGLLGGVAPVEVERITYEAIRTGAWRAPVGAEPAGEVLTRSAPATLAAELAADPIADIVQRSSRRWAEQAAARPGASAAEAPQADGTAATAVADGATPPPVLPPESAAPARAAAKAARGFWLQLGAFARHDGAAGFQQQVARDAGWLAPLMTIFSERQLHRLQAGPYASRADAQHAAERLREALRLVPAIVERR